MRPQWDEDNTIIVSFDRAVDFYDETRGFPQGIAEQAAKKSDAELANTRAASSKKDAALEEKDAEIAKLKALLAKQAGKEPEPNPKPSGSKFFKKRPPAGQSAGEPSAQAGPSSESPLLPRQRVAP